MYINPVEDPLRRGFLLTEVFPTVEGSSLASLCGAGSNSFEYGILRQLEPFNGASLIRETVFFEQGILYNDII